MNNRDHTCDFDRLSKSIQSCRFCYAWWEPTGNGNWAMLNREQRRGLRKRRLRRK